MKNLIILLALVGGAYALFNAYRSSQEEAKEARTVRGLPPSVQHVVAQMDGASQAAFFNEYERKKKKKSVGWILWFAFGWHYLYARKVGLQFAFWITCGGAGIWAFADLFRMPSIIRSANEQIAREALQTLHIGVAFAGMPTAAPSATMPARQFGGFAPPVAAVGSGVQPPASVPPATVTSAATIGQWAADPYGRHQLRYWDGTKWTSHVSTGGVQSTDG